MLRVIVMLAIGSGLARLTCYPLPDLHGPGGIDKNDEMLVRRFGDLRFKFAAGCIAGNAAGSIGLTLEDLHAAFFCNSAEGIGVTVYCDGKLCGVAIPA